MVTIAKIYRNPSLIYKFFVRIISLNVHNGSEKGTVPIGQTHSLKNKEEETVLRSPRTQSDGASFQTGLRDPQIRSTVYHVPFVRCCFLHFL